MNCFEYLNGLVPSGNYAASYNTSVLNQLNIIFTSGDLGCVIILSLPETTKN
jgi:hypothetical protein